MATDKRKYATDKVELVRELLRLQGHTIPDGDTPQTGAFGECLRAFQKVRGVEDKDVGEPTVARAEAELVGLVTIAANPRGAVVLKLAAQAFAAGGFADFLTALNKILEFVDDILSKIEDAGALVEYLLEKLGIDLGDLDLKELRRWVKVVKAMKEIVEEIVEILDDVQSGRKTFLEGLLEILKRLRRIVDLLAREGWIEEGTGAGILELFAGIESIIEGLKLLKEGDWLEGLRKILHDVKVIVAGLHALGLIDRDTRDAITELLDGLLKILDGIEALRDGNTTEGILALLCGVKKAIRALRDLGVIE